MKLNIRLRNAIRRRQIYAGVLFTALCLTFSLIVFFNGNEKIHANANGDIRSIASGNWNTLAIWQKFNGTSWVAATSIPANGDNVITIQSGHTVTITANLTVDQVVVEAGAVLIQNSGVTTTLKKLAIPDMKVYGIFRNAGTVSVAGGTWLAFYDGGKYQHNFTSTAGTIPLSVWNTGSTCEIIGYTTNATMPSGLDQTFTNLIWNCPNQTVNVNFGGGLSNFTGNFIVQSTGNNELQLANNNYTLNITGNIRSEGGILNFNNAATKTVTINQTGDFIISGGTINFSSGNSVTGNLNLTGNFTQSGGTLNFGQGTSAISNINISGNFSHTGGTLTASGSGSTGKFVFNKAGAQTFTASNNTVSGNVDYVINSGSTLNMGTNVMLGRNFTLSAGGELGIGSPVGISATGASGNIQVSGTRSYNAGGFYLYNGNVSQVTGDGLPASINKLTINNGQFLTLSSSVTVTNILGFINGRILPSTFDLHLTNTSAAAVTGQSENSYVAGSLRRTITATGNYLFPVGSLARYEPMSVSTSGVAGATSMTAAFVNAATNDTSQALDVVLNGIELVEMLNYGYWTLVPNSSLTGGTYGVQLMQSGFTNQVATSTYFGVLVRTNSTSPWQSIGSHNESLQSYSGSVVTAERTGLTSFYQYGIGLGDYLAFSSPSLISGTNGNPGALYLFPNVMRGIDAWIEIVKLYNGATLSEIDNSSTGYSESFQPFVNYPANKDSYVEWKIYFKKAGTSTDTTLKKVLATGVDVDGSGSLSSTYIREYIVATMPTSYSLDNNTLITMSNDSGHYKALGPTTTFANIDTADKAVMYQLTYYNVSNIMYRTGAVNNFTSTQTRQTSLYFRPFLYSTPVYALPVSLVSFDARLRKGKVVLNWTTASETNNDYFSIEQSEDCESYKTLFTRKGAGNSNVMRHYEMVDESPIAGISYYRLRQTDYDGTTTVTPWKVIKNSGVNSTEAPVKINNVSPNPFYYDFEVDFFVKDKGVADLRLMSHNGNVLFKKEVSVNEGYNRYSWHEGQHLKSGVYYVVIEQRGHLATYKVIKN